MPATATDIAAGSREAAVAPWKSATIASRYPSARDGLAAPAEGFCDAIADAQTLVNQRGDLVGIERRRFAVDAQAVIWPDIMSAVPTARLIDAEQSVDGSHLQARIEINLEAETTSLELFG